MPHLTFTIPCSHSKIILSTPVAESSYTIPALDIVVDFGRCKRSEVNTLLGATWLELEWCSKAATQQRSGRVGRTHDGTVYRLYPEGVFTHMAPFNPSAVQDGAVDQVQRRLV